MEPPDRFESAESLVLSAGRVKNREPSNFQEAMGYGRVQLVARSKVGYE